MREGDSKERMFTIVEFDVLVYKMYYNALYPFFCRHTSVLLDLKSRANVLNFMNIIVDETPIIPYEVFRRYVAGSPQAHVTVCGDVIGPAFPGDTPVNLESLFPTGHGRYQRIVI